MREGWFLPLSLILRIMMQTFALAMEALRMLAVVDAILE
jgi:hypothetical protein